MEIVVRIHDSSLFYVARNMAGTCTPLLCKLSLTCHLLIKYVTCYIEEFKLDRLQLLELLSIIIIIVIFVQV